MKAAAIDTGTNSIRLLIAEQDGPSYRTLERKTEATRIGKELDSTGMIPSSSFRAAAGVLNGYRKMIYRHQVTASRAVGTSALRKASNSERFIAYILKNSGIKIEKISAEEEASLSFEGASGSLETDRTVMVIDIGGGSTEFILGEKNGETTLNRSIDIGCVSLTEKFIKGDRPGGAELEKMHSYIKDRLSPVIVRINKEDDIVLTGVAGTVTTIAAIDLKLEKYDSSRIHHHIITREKARDIYRMLCRLDLKGRKGLKGLPPDRADIIIGGTAVLVEILEGLAIDHLVVSEKDILDGIIYSLTKF